MSEKLQGCLVLLGLLPLTVGQMLVPVKADGRHPLSAEQQTVYEHTVRPFLEQHCFRCHGPKERKAGLRLDDLGTDFLAGKTADKWKEVIDNINLGRMPPKKSPRPDPANAFAVVEWVGKELKRAERDAKMTGGRTLIRRLNRNEYAYTIQDLLALDPAFVRKITAELPSDGTVEGFDRVSSGLFVDQVLMDSYLDITPQIAAETIVTEQAPKSATVRLDMTKVVRPAEAKMVPYRGGAMVHVEFPTGAVGTVLRNNGAEFSWTEFKRAPTNRRFLGLEGFQLGQLYKSKIAPMIRNDGYYRIRVHAGAEKGTRGEPIQLLLEYKYGASLKPIYLTIDAPLDRPRDFETVVFLRKPDPETAGSLDAFMNGVEDLIVRTPELLKHQKATGDAIQAVTKASAAHRPKEEIEQLTSQMYEAVKQFKAFEGPCRHFNPKYDPKHAPRLLLCWMEVEGPVFPSWPPPSHKQLLFGDRRYKDDAYLRDIFRRFLPRAYRRPVTSEEVERVVGIVQKAMIERKQPFFEAMRTGLQTVLCSPSFLYLEQPAEPSVAARRLNDYELASRISYFLWSSMPDDELFDLAAKGRLRGPAVLNAQVTRMIRDPKSRRFVENFAGQWLQVRDYGSVQPDARLYKSYDAELLAASREEPYAFFGHILHQNLSVLNFLDSDFLVLNERLAKHYGIDGAKGREFRKVAIKSEHHRGGVLGMTGLLTLLSDGTRTLPVRRGAWVRDRLFNDSPPPPPPNAGDLQPNTSGKLTVRERLKAHRQGTCASCHESIDPLGLALENYDAIGAWRTQERGVRGSSIDVSGALPARFGGRRFKDVAGYKSALLAEKSRFARALAQKLLTYVLCRPVGEIDRATVSAIEKSAAANEYRMQAFLQAVVASEAFLSK